MVCQIKFFLHPVTKTAPVRITCKYIVMRIFKPLLAALFILAAAFNAGAQTKPVEHFTKVIVSPFIQVTFVQGETEGVTVNDIMVDSSKLHIEVHNGTLRLYLDGAKDIPGYKEVHYDDGSKQRLPMYPKHAVTATVTYKSLEALSVRGEESHVCQSPLSAEYFSLRVYGESSVTFSEMHVNELNTIMYGEGNLEIKSGDIEDQDYTCYGEGKINTTAVSGKTGRATAYGEAEFRLNVRDRIKITAFGEAKLRYMGSPEIVKGLHFGGLDLKKIN